MITNQIEIYQVSGKNKSVTVQSNRPLFRLKGLKHRKPSLTINAGELHNKDFLEKIYEAIMLEVDT